MAFDLSSPVAKLAFEMALKNQQAIDSGGQFDTQARGFVSKALATGNDPFAPFEDVYRSYVDPAEAQRRAQAQAFNAYLVGLPELLAQAAKEGRSSTSATGDVDTTNVSNYETPAQRFERLFGSEFSTNNAGQTPKVEDAREYRKRVTNNTGMGSGRVTAKAIR